MSTDTHLSTVALKLSSWAAALAVIAGVMVLVGWTFDITVLKSILPGWVSMKANTATCFILIGIALWLTAHPPATSNPQLSIFFLRLARFFSLLVGLTGLLTLGEYIFGWSLGIDLWLFQEPVGTVGTLYPGRMTAEVALLFVLLATALWITIGSRKKHGVVLTSKILSILVTTLAVGEILSYATPGLGPYVWFGFPIMSVPSALLFAILGMAVIAVNWQRGILRWSLGSGTTAAFVCGMAVLVFVGLSINRSQFWLDEANRKISSSEDVLSTIVSIQLELTEAQAHTRGYVITGDKGFLGAYLGDISVYHLKMDALRQRINGNTEQLQQLSLIETNVDSLQRWTQQFIDAPQTGKNTRRRKMDVRGDEFLDSIHATFDQIENEHQQLISELRQNSASVARFLYITITTGTFVSLLIFMTVIFRLNSTINERMRAEESSRKLSQVVEQNPNSIMITDLNANIEYVNAAFVMTAGYSLTEVIGQNPRLLQSGKTPRETYEEMWACLKRGEIWKGEFINKRKDGSDYIESVLMSPIRQTDGRVTHYLSIKDDITQFKQAQEEIKFKNTILQTQQEVSQDAILIIDENGNILSYNQNFIDLWRIPPQIVSAGLDVPMIQSVVDQVENPEAFVARIQYLYEHHDDKSREEIQFKDGRIIDRYSAPVNGADGKYYGRVWYFRDITEHQQADAKLAEQLEELRRWHVVTSGREGRILNLKHEVNELLAQTGQPARYPSAESQGST